MATEKIKFISYLQIIGIILVVVGHSFHEYPDGNHGMDMLLYRMMHSFRMPLFMFTSGFLLIFTTKKRPRPWRELALSKVKRLMIPFLFLSVVAFIPRALLSGMADDSIHLTWHSFLVSLIDGNNLVIPFFWFLQSSFTLLLSVYCIMLIVNFLHIKPALYYPILLILIVILNLIPVNFGNYFSIGATIALAIYFVMGCIYGELQQFLDRHIKWDNPFLVILFTACWALLFFDNHFSGYLHNVLCSTFGIAMIMSIARIIDNRNIRVLDHLIGTNYIIFLLSWFFNVSTQQILSHYIDFPWWAYTLLSIILSIYMPWLIFKWIKRNTDTKLSGYISFLLGQ